jgi:hypothetical protein
MGKYFLLLIPLLIWGCDKTYDNVVDTSTENYQVTSIVGIKDTVDLKVAGDSLLTPRLIFTSQSNVNKVYFNIYASDNLILNSSPIEMEEISNNIFENQFVLNREDPIGNYSVKFSVTGFDGKNNQVAISSFYFNNGQDNVAPVISNVNMPDTIQAGETIRFTVEVSDSNGLNDVEFVFYEAYDPDGNRVVNTQGIYQFPMFDDGNNGDITAGDGIYSVILTFPTSTQLGTWRFQFQAEDRSNVLSNILNHYVLIQ